MADINKGGPLPTSTPCSSNANSASPLASALRAGSAGAYAQFSGQGKEWLPELKRCLKECPAVRTFVEAAVTRVLTEVQSPECKKLSLHAYGLDVLNWIDDEESAPPQSYLSFAPVSYPMISLTQLANYMACMKEMGLGQSDMLTYLKGTTGHSQGVVSAVVVAMSSTDEELYENTAAFIAYLMWQGTRTQLAYGETPVIKNDEGQTVSPMLAVVGLLPQHVQKCVSGVNEKLNLRPERGLSIALINGHKRVVVAGHADALVALERALVGFGAKAGEEQVLRV